MTRRDFSRWMLSVGALLMSGGASALTRHSQLAAAVRDVFYYLDDQAALAALGREFVRTGRARRGIGRSPEQWQQAIVTDFAQGRVAMLNGWLVSETEGELAARFFLDGGH